MTSILDIKDMEILDPEGRAHRVGSLWAQRPVVLVFTRHFG